MQLENMNASNTTSVMQTKSKKKSPTGNKTGRSTAAELIIKTKHKVENFFRNYVPQSNGVIII